MDETVQVPSSWALRFPEPEDASAAVGADGNEEAEHPERSATIGRVQVNVDKYDFMFSKPECASRVPISMIQNYGRIRSFADAGRMALRKFVLMR